MTKHLGLEMHGSAANAAGKTRYGPKRKTIQAEIGELAVEIPRNRSGSKGLQLIAKQVTQWAGLDAKILSLHVTVRLFIVRHPTTHHSALPRDEALAELSYQGRRNISRKWPMLIGHWKVSWNCFTIRVEQRVP